MIFLFFSLPVVVGFVVVVVVMAPSAEIVFNQKGFSCSSLGVRNESRPGHKSTDGHNNVTHFLVSSPFAIDKAVIRPTSAPMSRSAAGASLSEFDMQPGGCFSVACLFH